jgi:Zn-dependent protease with chaperone function
MSYAATLLLVLLATYALSNVALSIAVAGFWSGWLEPKALSSRALLTLRLLPGVGALLPSLCVVLPAFLIGEPTRAAEPAGLLLWLLAAAALVAIGAGCVRGWRAWGATAELLRDHRRTRRRCLIAGRTVDIVGGREAMVAVVGVWTPRIVAASSVLAACSREELREIIGHEAAHIRAHDNLKLLLLIASPDVLTWLPAGAALIKRWRAAVEFEADAASTGPDRRKRVALASALIKVARLSAAQQQRAQLSMPIAMDDVDCRVRRLLAPFSASLGGSPGVPPLKIMVLCVLLVAACGVPLYGQIQELIEALVAT